MNTQNDSSLSRFLEANKNNYTISVATFANEENASNFVNGFFNSHADVLSFEIEQNFIVYTKVIYGIYESKEAAKKALKKLAVVLKTYDGMSVKTIGRYKKYM